MIFRRFPGSIACVVLLSAAGACSSEEPGSTNNGGSGPAAGASSGGAAGTTGGAAGQPGGSGGSAGTSQGGAAGGAGVGGSNGGAAGSAGSAGTADAGSAGTSSGGAGSGGDAGTGGGAGTGGVSGSGGSSGTGGSGGASGDGGAAGSGGGGPLTLTITGITNMPGCAADMAASCATIPVDHTSFGANISPEMSWAGVPAGTESFVVVHQDLSNGFAHWVLWNIPASVTMLAENVPKNSATPATPAGSQQCSLGQGDGYFGSGACGNVYEFLVYALSIPTFSPTQATDPMRVRAQLLELDDQILGTASVRARSFEPECG